MKKLSDENPWLLNSISFQSKPTRVQTQSFYPGITKCCIKNDTYTYIERGTHKEDSTTYLLFKKHNDVGRITSDKYLISLDELLDIPFEVYHRGNDLDQVLVDSEVVVKDQKPKIPANNNEDLKSQFMKKISSEFDMLVQLVAPEWRNLSSVELSTKIDNFLEAYELVGGEETRQTKMLRIVKEYVC